MVELLEKAFAEITKLPEEEQETMAQWILDELEDGRWWDKAFADSLPHLETLARKALADFEAGRTQELDPDELE